MQYIIDHVGKRGTLNVVILDNVQATAQRLSTLFPGEEVMVWAAQGLALRPRLVVKDGDLLHDYEPARVLPVRLRHKEEG